MTRSEEILDAILALGLKPRPVVRKVEAYLGYDITLKERNKAWRAARVADSTPVGIAVSKQSRRCRAGRCFYKGKSAGLMRSHLSAECLAAIADDPLLEMS